MAHSDSTASADPYAPSAYLADLFARRFPGATLTVFQRVPQQSMVRFVGEPGRLVELGLIGPELVPRKPKRTAHNGKVHGLRAWSHVCAGQLYVDCVVLDALSTACALAMFRPSNRAVFECEQDRRARFLRQTEAALRTALLLADSAQAEGDGFRHSPRDLERIRAAFARFEQESQSIMAGLKPVPTERTLRLVVDNGDR